jgi:membrane protein DedA with SNARE-associated domain
MDAIIQLLDNYAHQLPLELFVFVGSFIEEAISPIPSFLVMLPAGAIAHVQGVALWYLAVLGVIGAAGRVLASLLLYFLASKAEGWIFGKGRRFFGVTHKDVTRFGKRLSGTKRDWLVLFLLNAVPVLPTSLLSVACGFVKVDLRLFITATFLGTAVNDFIYMFIGYEGLQIIDALHRLDKIFQIIAGIAIVILLGWFMYYRKKKRGR